MSTGRWAESDRSRAHPSPRARFSAAPRRLALAALALLLAALFACGGARDREGGSAPPSSGGDALSRHSAAAPGAHVYATDLSDDGKAWIAAELGTDFDLVYREIDKGRAREEDRARERHRVSLGPHAYDINAVALGPRARTAWVASADGRIRAFDMKAGEDLLSWRLEAPATAIALSPDGRYAATGSAGGALCLRRVRDGALLQCAIAGEGAIADLDASPGGVTRVPEDPGSGVIASATESGEVILWDLPSLEKLGAFRGDSAGAVAVCGGAPLRLAAARAGCPARKRPRAESEGDCGARVELREIGDGHRGGAISALRGHTEPITAVDWVDSACELFISSSWDGTARLWRAGTGEIGRAGPFGHGVRDIAAGGNRAAAAAWEGLGGGKGAVLLDIDAAPRSAGRPR